MHYLCSGKIIKIKMLNKIEELKKAVEALKVSSMDEIEAARIKYLSKKGEISQLFNDFRNVPNEQKREIGQRLNELKNLATDKINALKAEFENNNDANAEVDLTRTAAPYSIGTRHPLSLVKEEIIAIFSRLGYTIAEGPEVEECSLRLILPPTTLPATCKTHSSFNETPTYCCAHTHRRCKRV